MDNGGCSHLCLSTPVGRRCQCPDTDAYELEADGVTCVVPEAFILYTQKRVVGRLSLKPGIQNDYTLPLPDVSDASALDFDRTDGRIYWSDIEDKTISRAHLNGSGVEVVVRHGLDFPDGLAVDWNAGNVYWTDMKLNRIEVCRKDGSFRRVLVWRDLIRPSSIALDPGREIMYWSSWGDTPLIEQAALDGSDRGVFKRDVGRTNGLTVDFLSSRIYWTDLDQVGADSSESGASICYSQLRPGQATKVVTMSSPRPYGLTLFRNDIYWADWRLGAVKRANKESGAGEVVIQTNITNVMDIMVYDASLQHGSNECKENNGECPALCLSARGKKVCACPSHFRLSEEEDTCLPPDDFILFSQKNKISRLYQSDDEDEEEEVPDLILPIQGSRDVRALSYDPARRLIYWVDRGSKRTHHRGGGGGSGGGGGGRFSVKRAFDNGTLVGRRLQGGEENLFEPLDLAVDPINRLLFWISGATGSINVTRMFDDDENDSIGVVIGGMGEEEEPKKIALHYHKG